MKIAILGLGWLGEALAHHLLRIGNQVSGTYRTNVSAIADCFPLVLPVKQQLSMPPQFLEAEVLIITLPPSGHRLSQAELYRDFLHLMLNEYHPKWKKLLVCSSTSVYGAHQGEVDEHTPPKPDGPRGEAQILLEEALQEFPFEISCLRLGGLIGPERHPIKTMQGKIGVPPGHINLIDQLDILNAIDFLLEQSELPKVVNIVSPYHPLKEEYYRSIAESLQLTPPSFSQERQEDRIVQPRYLLDLGFSFKNPKLHWTP